MAGFKKIARRTFLVGSSAIAGGVAFGAYKLAKPPSNPLMAGEGEVTFNAWVKIDQNGITLITPHIDIGQGATSMQAMLICEELDVDLDQIKTDQGQPAQAYWNGALAPETAEFVAGKDHGTIYEGIVNLADIGMRAGSFQITGGSSSTPDSYVKLRQAGASARETLKLAAAKKSGVDVSELQTERGAVVFPDGSQMLYTELASDAAKVKVVQDVPLRDPSEWRLVGNSVERIDIPSKVVGAPIYSIDMHLEGMVYAAARRNPFKGGGIVSFDASAAKNMRGVIDVVAVTDGFAVVADNTWRALQALDFVKAEWKSGDYPAEQEDHWALLERSFGGDDYNSRKRDDGDIEEALSSGESIESEYRVPYLAHATLEPLNATVLINEDRAEVWIGTQAPALSQSEVAKIAGLKPEQVHMNVTYAGGGFGIRSKPDPERVAAEIAVQMRGKPVKLTLSREEDFTRAPTRQIAMARMRGKASADGVEALDLSIAMPNTMSNSSGNSIPDPQCVAGAWAEPLAIPNVRVTGHSAPGLAPTYYWRSVGASSNGFFYNSAFDELLAQGDLDPLEERLRLCNDDVARKVLEAVGEMSNWQGRDLGANKGRGLAYTSSFGVPTAEVVDISLTDRGIRIDHVFAALDVGRIVDPVNFEAQVQGGIIWGLGHAMNCDITYKAGAVEQMNYYDYEAMRLYQCPEIEVWGLENGEHVRGVGEPSVPPASAALANAIFALTGERLREMPFNKFVEFV